MAQRHLNLATDSTEAAPELETWTSRLGFFYATAAAAIGLGSLWRFPYVAGANGGGAFVVLYIGMIAILCVPLMIAEMALGRFGHGSVVGSIGRICPVHDREHGAEGGALLRNGWLVLTQGLGRPRRLPDLFVLEPDDQVGPRSLGQVVLRQDPQVDGGMFFGKLGDDGHQPELRERH